MTARRQPRKRASVPQSLQDASRGIRLQKAMAEAGVASRRDCEALIEEGRVHVNGELVRELPAWVDPAQDRIEVDGEEIARPRKTSRRSAAKTYIMLNKPRGVISTTDDPEGRRSVTDLIDLPGHHRLFPVGRLDADSTGLILLTDDGELANRLTHPRYGIAKQYQVAVRGKLGPEDMTRMRQGLFLAHRDPDAPRGTKVKKAAVEHVRIVSYEQDRTRGDRTTLAITLREGQNREIRRLLARLGYKVRKLKRVGIGPLQLKSIRPGAWRPLTTSEVRLLYQAAGINPKQ